MVILTWFLGEDHLDLKYDYSARIVARLRVGHDVPSKSLGGLSTLQVPKLMKRLVPEWNQNNLVNLKFFNVFQVSKS